jgi:exodeoxyribonuclease V alpha subunit
MGRKIVMAAPTGRASQRMTEVIGKEAFTIHRLLVWRPSEGVFKYNEENNLDLDVIIVDEVSMLDIFLATSLIKALPDNCQVIFIGDKDQLPSVGPGNVLKDLLSSQIIPHFKLSKIFRQAEKSKIITYAHQINMGQIPLIESPIKNRELFGSEIDCLFIDSDEANQEQLKFIKNAKNALLKALEGNKIAFNKKNNFETVYKVSDNIYSYNLDNEEIENYETIKIPEKFLRTDLVNLVKSKNIADELKNILSKIPKYSTLNYGLTASQSIIRLITQTLPKIYPNLEIQVLSPMIRGSLGTHLLNKEIQNAVNPPSFQKEEILIGERIFRLGDRVIQTVNNYNLEIIDSNDLGVFNGEIGKIVKVDKSDNSLIVDFANNKKVRYENSDIGELSLAYAITIHKSQGSEFPIIIIPILTQHFNMLFRNLIYTGLTRAKKLAIFVGSRRALAMAINHNYTQERQTTLKYLLDGT